MGWGGLTPQAQAQYGSEEAYEQHTQQQEAKWLNSLAGLSGRQLMPDIRLFDPDRGAGPRPVKGGIKTSENPWTLGSYNEAGHLLLSDPTSAAQDAPYYTYDPQTELVHMRGGRVHPDAKRVFGKGDAEYDRRIQMYNTLYNQTNPTRPGADWQGGVWQGTQSDTPLGLQPVASMKPQANTPVPAQPQANIPVPAQPQGPIPQANIPVPAQPQGPIPQSSLGSAFDGLTEGLGTPPPPQYDVIQEGLSNLQNQNAVFSNNINSRLGQMDGRITQLEGQRPLGSGFGRNSYTPFSFGSRLSTPTANWQFQSPFYGGIAPFMFGA